MGVGTIVHIILGSALTIAMLITAFQLLQFFLSKSDKKPIYLSKVRQYGITSIILFAVYMLWIAKKSMLLG
ncbi:hypothetical protein [Desulfuribacillus alkaliarsenatis]|uniref:Cytochrome b561 domain-containing protein n=1 Tax=Desulfuribacillus alkaliarsenatis TaxID=766136 RepID=A0A1E5G2W2_9FIRM|nr:hypothetical protein [Desulfuribacillus alkaliarsenatis]OEF97407.1 hypothetical protein BHF68_04150 [Desulfuribacillus alkaliarsenatis]